MKDGMCTWTWEYSTICAVCNKFVQIMESTHLMRWDKNRFNSNPHTWKIGLIFCWIISHYIELEELVSENSKCFHLSVIWEKSQGAFGYARLPSRTNQIPTLLQEYWVGEIRSEEIGSTFQAKSRMYLFGCDFSISFQISQSYDELDSSWKKYIWYSIH